MKNVPKKIYLQIDADGETPEDFNELRGISWADEKINHNDISYKRTSFIVLNDFIIGFIAGLFTAMIILGIIL